jgi:hypothetical protein
MYKIGVGSEAFYKVLAVVVVVVEKCLRWAGHINFGEAAILMTSHS